MATDTKLQCWQWDRGKQEKNIAPNSVAPAPLQAIADMLEFRAQGAKLPDVSREARNLYFPMLAT